MATNYVPPSDQLFQDLGLLDPASGRLTFDPTGGTGRVWDVDDDEGLNPNAFDDEDVPRSKPEVTQQTATQGTNWDSDENPYKQRVVEFEKNQPSPGDQIKAQLRENVSKLDAQANEAYTLLTSQRDGQGNPLHDPNLVASQVKAQRDALVMAEIQSAERALTQPIAQRAVAEDIVRKVGGNVQVSDIIDLPTPQAMEAVARRISVLPNGSGAATNERDQKFQERRASGVDTVEAGAPLSRSIQDSLSKLSSHDKIAYSLRYQSQS